MENKFKGHEHNSEEPREESRQKKEIKITGPQAIEDKLATLKGLRDENERRAAETSIYSEIERADVVTLISMVNACKDEHSLFQDLPQDSVTALLRRLFEDPQTNTEDFLGELGFFGGAVPEHRTRREPELLCDKIMNALTVLYKQYPKQAENLFQSFGQQAQMIEFNTYLSATIQMVSDPRCPSDLRMDLLATLNYETTFNYLHSLKQKIEQADDIRGSQTLDLLYLVANYGEQWHFSEDAMREIRQSIEKLSKTAINYYVSARARHLVEAEDITRGWSTAGLRAAVEQSRKLLDTFGVEIDETQLNNRAYLEALVDENRGLFKEYLQWNVFIETKGKEEDAPLARAVNIPGLKKDDFIIKRIAKNKIGIYSQDYSLFGYVDEARVQAGDALTLNDIKDITAFESIFSKEMSPIQQRDLLSDLRYLHNLQMRQKIERDFGINYEDLSLREQLWFLEFLRDKKKEEAPPIASFVRTYGLDGVRVFSALEHEHGAAQAVFEIAHVTPQKEASALFHTYAELAQRAERIDEEAREFFKKEQPELGGTERRATQEIMKRAGALLIEFAHTAIRDIQELKRALEETQTETIAFAAIFKAAYAEREGTLNFEEVRGLDFEERPAQFTPDEQEEMETIIKKNYAGTPLAEGVLKGFHGALGKENNTFYILKREGKIISFNRFEERQKAEGGKRGVVEFASFNTDPEYQNAAIGRAMMKKTLDQKARDNVIFADTDPLSPVCSFYVEQAGFIITGAEEYKGTSVHVLSIERDDQSPFSRKGETADLGDEKNVAERVKKITDAGKVLTRYFKKGDRFMGVVEERQARPV